MLEIKSTKLGAELTSVKLDGVERLYQGNSVLDENGKPYWGRHSPILFPIVGKLKDNKTSINGKIYEMTQHGFARDMEFTQITKSENIHTYILKSNSETLKKFPFEFELYVQYEIKKNELFTTYTVVNTDSKEMLFGLGGHPAFICDYSSENYELQFNKKEDKIEFYNIQEGLILENKSDNILTNNAIKLTKGIFENDAIIMKKIASNKVKLQDICNNKTILEFNFEGFSYLAIWAKKGAPFVCIEPWQNHTDSVNSKYEFSQKEDILKLKENEKFSCTYSVKLY